MSYLTESVCHRVKLGICSTFSIFNFNALPVSTHSLIELIHYRFCECNNFGDCFEFDCQPGLIYLECINACAFEGTPCE